MKTPKLMLTSAKAASITYSFVTEGEGFKSWALCTVNDQTGELLITSDWGSWSYRWHASPEALGAPTLTAFIGRRDDVDYMARKLQSGGRGGLRFSEEKTVQALRRLLCVRRMADGRERLKYRLEPKDYDDGQLPNHLMRRYTEAGLPLLSHRQVDSPSWQDPTRKEYLPYLTAEAARTLWDEIGETIDECGSSTDLMSDRLLQLSGFSEYVTDEPWDCVETEQTPEDRALRDIVLPALIKACKSMEEGELTVAAAEPVAQDSLVPPTHVVDQTGQPYGSERRCCNQCGMMAVSDMTIVESMAEWWSLPAARRCDRK